MLIRSRGAHPAARYREAAEVRSKEFGAHRDDTRLDAAGGELR